MNKQELMERARAARKTITVEVDGLGTLTMRQISGYRMNEIMAESLGDRTTSQLRVKDDGSVVATGDTIGVMAKQNLLVLHDCLIDDDGARLFNDLNETREFVNELTAHQLQQLVGRAGELNGGTLDEEKKGSEKIRAVNSS